VQHLLWFQWTVKPPKELCTQFCHCCVSNCCWWNNRVYAGAWGYWRMSVSLPCLQFWEQKHRENEATWIELPTRRKWNANRRWERPGKFHANNWILWADTNTLKDPVTLDVEILGATETNLNQNIVFVAEANLVTPPVTSQTEESPKTGNGHQWSRLGPLTLLRAGIKRSSETGG
jgi:hypothetical protein